MPWGWSAGMLRRDAELYYGQGRKKNANAAMPRKDMEISEEG